MTIQKRRIKVLMDEIRDGSSEEMLWNKYSKLWMVNIKHFNLAYNKAKIAVGYIPTKNTIILNNQFDL